MFSSYKTIATDIDSLRNIYCFGGTEIA